MPVPLQFVEQPQPLEPAEAQAKTLSDLARVLVPVFRLLRVLGFLVIAALLAAAAHLARGQVPPPQLDAVAIARALPGELDQLQARAIVLDRRIAFYEGAQLMDRLARLHRIAPEVPGHNRAERRTEAAHAGAEAGQQGEGHGHGLRRDADGQGGVPAQRARGSRGDPEGRRDEARVARALPARARRGLTTTLPPTYTGVGGAGAPPAITPPTAGGRSPDRSLQVGVLPASRRSVGRFPAGRPAEQHVVGGNHAPNHASSAREAEVGARPASAPVKGRNPNPRRTPGRVAGDVDGSARGSAAGSRPAESGTLEPSQVAPGSSSVAATDRGGATASPAAANIDLETAAMVPGESPGQATVAGMKQRPVSFLSETTVDTGAGAGLQDLAARRFARVDVVSVPGAAEVSRRALLRESRCSAGPHKPSSAGSTPAPATRGAP